MSFLLLVLLGLLILNVVTSANGPKPKPISEYVMDVPKNCPPHKWNYREVKDLEGNVVKWKMVCDICGPMKPIGQ